MELDRAHFADRPVSGMSDAIVWTPDGLLRHAVYLGEREDKPAIEVRRSPPEGR